ncbi:uncharacterized protein LOC121611784 [Chelmon rostratus]|uniref:uncharacterized protein LOC121611784 n=1 Tax=Chelmon rostratus TaxID=109905 RepID=UPI001BEB0690|nr:uncharacterized protein LOC121611784 [Chelmon rostratus]
MEDTVSTATERTTGKNGGEGADQRVLMSSKPLHRFIQQEPKSLGIVIVIFGCAELLMGFNLATESTVTSYNIYIPFWQGLLFLVCGNLSIYTEAHPSKRMVTVCLAMYLISLFGIIVSAGYRIHCFLHYSWLRHRMYWAHEWMTDDWSLRRGDQLTGVEGLLFTSSLCVFVLLIFLCVIARLALKSTRTQVIVQFVPPPLSDTPSN